MESKLKERRTSLKLHEEVELLKERRKTGDGKFILEVQESVHRVQGQLYNLQWSIGSLVLLTLLLGILVNELCSGNDYLMEEPTVAEVEAIREQNGRSCAHESAEYIKIVLSILTVALLSLVVRQWWLRTRLQEHKKRIKEYYFMPGGTHLKRRIPLSMWASLVVEVCICLIHPIPFVHLDVEVQFILEAPLFYRFESCMVGFMFLRIYLLWRWFRLIAFYRFLCLEDSFAMEDYTALDQMHLSANISAHTFPLKVMLLAYPVRVVAATTSVIFFTMSYAMRVTEGPAYQPHSGDWWDQMWVTITQGTTGYGGTTPVTQWGRFCSVVMMLLGPMAVSFMTATTAKSITLTDDERALHEHMEANTCKIKVLSSAAELIQYWWRARLQTNPLFQKRRRTPSRFSMSPGRPDFAREVSNNTNSTNRRRIPTSDPEDASTPTSSPGNAPLHSPRSIRSSQRGSVREGDPTALHEYSAGIRSVASQHRQRSSLRMRNSGSLLHAAAAAATHTKSTKGAGSVARTASIGMPVAATNPVALRFVYMLGEQYREAKRVLLVRNFYTALAAYDRFMFRHSRVTVDSFERESLPFNAHATPQGLDVGASGRGGVPPLHAEMAAMQRQLSEVHSSVDDIKRMLAALLPPEQRPQLEDESAKKQMTFPDQASPAADQQVVDGAAGVASGDLERQARRSNGVREGMFKTVSFRDQELRMANERVQSRDACKDSSAHRRHSENTKAAARNGICGTAGTAGTKVSEHGGVLSGRQVWVEGELGYAAHWEDTLGWTGREDKVVHRHGEGSETQSGSTTERNDATRINDPRGSGETVPRDRLRRSSGESVLGGDSEVLRALTEDLATGRNTGQGKVGFA